MQQFRFYRFFFITWLILFAYQQAKAESFLSDKIVIATLPSFEVSDYQIAIRQSLEILEGQNGKLSPKTKPNIGIKIYAQSGPGLRTPRNLVLALIEELLHRGYTKEDLFIADLSSNRLRDSGFLPPLSIGGNRFAGVQVIPLGEPERIDPVWFYESPLPPHRYSDPRSFDPREEQAIEDRNSYLPLPLLFQANFWFNLPVVTDHPQIGINAALTNTSLWTVTNNQRFFNNRISGAAAAAEIAAIPELQETYGLTLLSLEKVQFVAGPSFNANYTGSLPFLILGTDRVSIDRIALVQLNRLRVDRGFRPINPDLPILRYAASLGLGSPVLRPDQLLFLPSNQKSSQIFPPAEFPLE
ncbi:MAG: DUF362 domain-containing protein [Puniceicoccaceae bacterium]